MTTLITILHVLICVFLVAVVLLQSGRAGGMGVLSGKYIGDAAPASARLNRFHQFVRYRGPIAASAIEKYVGIAKRHGLDPAQMALAFVSSRPFVTANIIGATNLAQLRSNIASIDIKLSSEVLNEIDAVNKEHPYPCP